ncbi:MAG: hypothetical protein Q7K33_01660 [Candidatus Berkelbacteria bacterium]|nr:hypothetical protein [Candidatus Berkelbacteria bacterium]
MMRQLFHRSKSAFSLIEVLFAIAFLVLVGVAMASLNNAAARLTETTELKQMALGLNEQSIAFVALMRRTMGANFATTQPYQGCIGEASCYVICPPTDINQDCVLKSTNAKEAVKIGTSKLQFTPSVIIREAFGTGVTNKRYLVNATTSWGKGAQKQLTTARIIE